MFIGHEQLMILVIDILKNQQERILAGEFIVFRGKIPRKWNRYSCGKNDGFHHSWYVLGIPEAAADHLNRSEAGQ